MRALLLSSLLCVCALQCVNTLNILTIFPFHGKSHSIVLNAYIEGLLNRGHNVTNIAFFSIKNETSNYKFINLSGTMKILEDDFIIKRSYLSILEIMDFLVTTGNMNCKIVLENKEVQNLLKAKSKFDLVVVEEFNTDCPLALAYKLEAPVVGFATTVVMPCHYTRIGLLYNPSYVPLAFLDGDSNPTLYQRLERIVLYTFFNVYYKLGQRADERALLEYFDDIPPLEELARDMKYHMIYSSLMLFGSHLLPSNVIRVGGLHVKKPEPLPQDLQKFIDESEHGVIYVSFGSIIKSSISNADIINKIVAALSQLPQRVVWKWETATLPGGDPKKIYTSKWLPQQDILAHSNVVAFLSHCGLVGTTEAINFGVPIVGMPIFGDQPSNAAAIEEKGFGVRIRLSELTTDNLVNKFKTVLDPKFRENVKLLSKAWSDRPTSAMDTAMFWTEFAARHHNYTFRSPSADVPLYQYLCLDVILVIVLFFLAILCTLKYSLSVIFSNTNKKKDKKL